MERVIHKLDTFFKLDTKKIIGRGLYLLGGQMFGNIMSLAVALAAAHFVSKDVYGTYRYILSTVTFIGAFSLSGLGTAIVRSVAQGHDRIFRTSLKQYVLWSLPAMLVGVGAGIWYLAHNNTTLGISIFLGGILFPITQGLLLYKSYLNGKNLFNALMFSNIGYSFVTSGTILITLFFHPSALLLAIAYFVSNIFVTIIIAFVIRKKFPLNQSGDPESVTLAKHLSIMNILDTAATQLDKIILFHIAGPVEVARYTFAILFPEQVRNILKYIPTLSLPTFSALPEAVAKRKALDLIKKLFLITLPVVVGYFLIAPLAFKLFFPAYQEVVIYSQLFGIIMLFDGGIGGTFLKAQDQIKSLYWMTTASNVLKIVLLFALGWTWGIWGIIASRIISRIVGFLITYILVKRTKIA